LSIATGVGLVNDQRCADVDASARFSHVHGQT